MADFHTAHTFTAKWEGGLSDVPQDRGGITKYGVSKVFLKDFAKTQASRDVLDRMGVILPVTDNAIRQLTREQGEHIFRVAFWNPLKLDSLPQRPALFLYDCAVNHGPKRAVILVQRGVNAVSGGTCGASLVEDGKLGPLTRGEISRDTNAILKSCIAARRTFFSDIVKNDGTQAVFLNGWLNRCAALARALEVA